MKNDKIKTKDTIKTQSIGRPKKQLDKDVIAKLSQIGCTQEEIGSCVGISARTLQRRYADLVKENKNIGKASLRKKMWDKAMRGQGNDKLLIWLSKNELNMRDKIETQSIVEPLPLIIDAKIEEIDGEEKR
jgi:hypothetical protein